MFYVYTTKQGGNTFAITDNFHTPKKNTIGLTNHCYYLNASIFIYFCKNGSYTYIIAY